MKFDRISRAVRALVDVEKCSAAVQEEGVTRIPGAAVHVGLIDSRRRRARVISCNAAHTHTREWANTKADSASSFGSKIQEEKFSRDRDLSFFSFFRLSDILRAKWTFKSLNFYAI